MSSSCGPSVTDREGATIGACLPISIPWTPRTSPAAWTCSRTENTDGSGDHERFAHYVQKDKIVESAVLGTPVRALCGKVWVPGRDPSKFPVCPDCLKIYQSLRGGA